MTRRNIIILVGISLTILWLGVVYLVLQMPKVNPGSIAVSPTPHYVNTAKYPPTPIIGMKNGTIRVITRPAQRPTHVTLPSGAPSAVPSSPITYLSSNATMKSVGSGMGSGSWHGSAGTPSSGQRGIVYTSSSHSWIGFVSPVASRDMVYVESSAGSLPDRSYLSGAPRKAPPEESGGGTNGPNIDVEQSIGEGILFLLIAAVIYTIAIFFEHKIRKNKKL